MSFEKNNMKTFFTHGVGKPASLGTLPSRKRSLRNWTQNRNFPRIEN